MNRLDEVISKIANEPVPQDEFEQAAGRVRLNLFASTQALPDRIRGCADYQALIPSYLGRTLSAGRSLLLQDHTRECVACRHALQQARESSAPTLIRPMTPPSHKIHRGWAIAAAAVVVVGLGAMLARIMFPGSVGEATIQSVRGTLYVVADGKSTPVFAASKLPEGRRIRTSRESTAVVRLGDGSLVEMNERTELSLARLVRGTTVRLARGNIIVQAAKQRLGSLDVMTPDCTVSVKGTIFAVDLGTKGSRVSVVEGSVKVDQGAHSVLLKPGNQLATSPAVQTTSVQDAVGWSRESTRYMALLGEFSTIQKQLESMPSPGLRHDPALLKYIGRGTVLYAAIPNLGPTVTQAQLLFNERLQQSEVLKTWWAEQKDGDKLQAMVDKLRTFSSYLGDEIVLTVNGDSQGNYSGPMILAAVKKPGLDAFLNTEFGQIGGADAPKVMALKAAAPTDSVSPHAHMRRNRTIGAPGTSMMVGVSDGLMAIAWNEEQLNAVAQRMAQPADAPDEGGLAAKVRTAYADGVNYMLCVNMEHIARDLVNKQGENAPKLPSGLDGVRYLMIERKDVAGKTENQATLSFDGNRQGMAGWLSEPAAIGSLDFVSPNATFVVAMSLERPQWMFNDVLSAMATNDPKFQDKLADFRQQTGISVTSSLAKPLGGDVTFALDGPVLPLPSWKLAIEVYDPDRVEWTVEQFVSAYDAKPPCPNCTITLNKQQANGRTYYTLTNSQISYEIDYTFVDGYLLAAPSRTLLDSSIQNRATGNVLSRSEAFRSQLPTDGRLNFSALIYHNLGSVLSPLASTLGMLGSATPAEQQSVQALASNSGSGLIYAYGAPDRITVASSGSFFGLNLNTLALPALINRLHGKSMTGGPAAAAHSLRRAHRP